MLRASDRTGSSSLSKSQPLLVLTPFMIRALGHTQYGAWTLIVSITSYLSMLALGIPMTTVRFVARHSAGGQDEEMNRTISNCAALYLLIGLVSGAVGAVLWLLFDQVFAIPAEVRDEARWAFRAGGRERIGELHRQLPYGIMAAHGEFTKRNAVAMASIAIRVGLTLVLADVARHDGVACGHPDGLLRRGVLGRVQGSCGGSTRDSRQPAWFRPAVVA